MAAVYALLRQRERLGGALTWPRGVKLTGGLLLPFASPRAEARGRDRRRDLLIGTAAGAVAAGHWASRCSAPACFTSSRP